MRIICFADVRLPLLGAAGSELLATCRALVDRGHDLIMVVQADLNQPGRDVHATHGIERGGRLRFEAVAAAGRSITPRAAFLAFVAERALRRDADALYTRDPGIAAALIKTRRLLRPPFLYDSPGLAPAVAAALPDPPDDATMRALEKREEQIWKGADAYVGRTVGVVADLTRRHGRRRFVTVVTDEDVAGGHLAARIESLLQQIAGA